MARSGLEPPGVNVYTGLPSWVWLLSAKCLVPDAPLNPMSHWPGAGGVGVGVGGTGVGGTGVGGAGVGGGVGP